MGDGNGAEGGDRGIALFAVGERVYVLPPRDRRFPFFPWEGIGKGRIAEEESYNATCRNSNTCITNQNVFQVDFF